MTVSGESRLRRLPEARAARVGECRCLLTRAVEDEGGASGGFGLKITKRGEERE